MSRIIIITGELASGKSTLARNLSNKLDIPFVTKDDVKEHLADTIGFKDRTENRLLSIKAVDEIIHQVEEHLKKNEDFIIEANFRTSELEKIDKLIDQYESEGFLFCITGNDELLYERFLARVPTRHKAHLSIGLEHSFEKFKEYQDMLRKQNLVFPVHKIEIDQLNEQQVLEKAIKLLGY